MAKKRAGLWKPHYSMFETGQFLCESWQSVKEGVATFSLFASAFCGVPTELMERLGVKVSREVSSLCATGKKVQFW